MKNVVIDGVTYVPITEIWEAKVDGVRYLAACEVTQAQRDQAFASPLFKAGDIRLVWVNEGDLYRWKDASCLA